MHGPRARAIGSERAAIGLGALMARGRAQRRWATSVSVEGSGGLRGFGFSGTTPPVGQPDKTIIDAKLAPVNRTSVQSRPGPDFSEAREDLRPAARLVGQEA